MAKFKQKPLRYESHALRRIHGREISKERVADTIKNHEKTRPAARGGNAKVYMKRFGAGTLCVVAEETKDFIRVISAWVK